MIRSVARPRLLGRCHDVDINNARLRRHSRFYAPVRSSSLVDRECLKLLWVGVVLTQQTSGRHDCIHSDRELGSVDAR
jgi:hypothetical protein